MKELFKISRWRQQSLKQARGPVRPHTASPMMLVLSHLLPLEALPETPRWVQLIPQGAWWLRLLPEVLPVPEIVWHLNPVPGPPLPTLPTDLTEPLLAARPTPQDCSTEGQLHWGSAITPVHSAPCPSSQYPGFGPAPFPPALLSLVISSRIPSMRKTDAGIWPCVQNPWVSSSKHHLRRMLKGSPIRRIWLQGNSQPLHSRSTDYSFTKM